jgi:hypothetical protein
MKRGGPVTDRGEGSERTGVVDRCGQSELVGLVMLFGMVTFSALLVFVVGGALLDTVQEQTKVESAQQQVEVVDHRITQVANTREPTDIPFERIDDVDPAVGQGSTVTVGVAGCSREVSRTLSAVSYEFEDQSLIYEGGGIWRESEQGPVVRETPPIGYDRRGGEPLLTMQLINVTGQDDVAPTTGASFDENATVEFRHEIDELLEACTTEGDDLVLTVESRSRSSAWARAFEKTLHPERFSEVDVSHDAPTATATIHGIVGNETDDEENSVRAPPGTVTVTILGTEASIHRTSDGVCEEPPCDKGWLPITATVLQDGEEQHRFPTNANQSGPETLEHNLNTPADHDSVFQYTAEFRERTAVTLQASLYHCESFGFDDGYTDAPDVTGGPWDDKRCTGGLSADPKVTVDPVANPDEGNLVALRDGDVVKNLEQPGVGQTSITEMLAGKIDEETGELRLEDNQAVFLGELTQSDAEYSEVDSETTGDPNFNDFVVLLESEPGTELTSDGPRIRVGMDHVEIE